MTTHAAGLDEVPAKSFFSIREVASLFGVTDRTVRRWLASDRLDGVRLTPGTAGRIRIPRSSILDFVETAVR